MLIDQSSAWRSEERNVNVVWMRRKQVWNAGGLVSSEIPVVQNTPHPLVSGANAICINTVGSPFNTSSFILYAFPISFFFFQALMISSFKLIKLQALVAIFNLYYTCFYMQAKFNLILIIHIWHGEILWGRPLQHEVIRAPMPEGSVSVYHHVLICHHRTEEGRWNGESSAEKGHYNLWIERDPFRRDLRLKKRLWYTGDVNVSRQNLFLTSARLNI